MADESDGALAVFDAAGARQHTLEPATATSKSTLRDENAPDNVARRRDAQPTVTVAAPKAVKPPLAVVATPPPPAPAAPTAALTPLGPDDVRAPRRLDVAVRRARRVVRRSR